MAHNIPPATLAAGDQSDPAWWLACAEWHEQEAQSAREYPEYDAAATHHSAAALACRTFAAMMQREAKTQRRLKRHRWSILQSGDAMWGTPVASEARSLPAAAVAALTEDA
jgi:hypothetical protein